jgi:hypothetical protein
MVSGMSVLRESILGKISLPVIYPKSAPPLPGYGWAFKYKVEKFFDDLAIIRWIDQ